MGLRSADALLYPITLPDYKSIVKGYFRYLTVLCGLVLRDMYCFLEMVHGHNAGRMPALREGVRGPSKGHRQDCLCHKTVITTYN